MATYGNSEWIVSDSEKLIRFPISAMRTRRGHLMGEIFKQPIRAFIENGIRFRFVGDQRHTDAMYVDIPAEEIDRISLATDPARFLELWITHQWAEKYARRSFLEDAVGLKLLPHEDDIQPGVRATIYDYAKPVRRHGETNKQYNARPRYMLRPGTVVERSDAKSGRLELVTVRLEDGLGLSSPSPSTGIMYVTDRLTFIKRFWHHTPDDPAPDSSGDVACMEPRVMTLDAPPHYRLVVGAWLNGITFKEPKP